MSPMPNNAAAGVSPTTASLRLAGEHFAAATLYLLAGAIGLVWVAPELAAGNYLSPHVAGVTHLFTLGWLTTTIFGALYQLLPVALGASLRWPRLGHASFWTFAPGAGLFACGVAESSTPLHHAGIALVTIGIVLTVTNFAAALPRARNRDVTWAAIALAITFLCSTLVLGVVLLYNVQTGFIAAARVRVLATHLHVAIVGWAFVMIVGVSHRLLPMFLLAHGTRAPWTKRALVLLTAGISLLALGINASFPPVTWLALVLLELGLGCFLYQANSFYRARVRKQVDVGMRFAAAALAFMTAAAVVGPVVLWRGPAATHLATAYVLLALLGGIVLYVVGFFYKIVPLLAWTARYAARMSISRVPTVAEMYSLRIAEAQLALMPTAIAALAVGILFGLPAMTYAGSGLFLIGVLLFVGQTVRVAFCNSIGDRP